MHPPELRAEIKRLIAAGLNDCEVSRRTGIPRATVRDIRCRKHQCDGAPSSPTSRFPGVCPRCWRPTPEIGFTSDDYAELLALYLGDGCISWLGRTYSLRIALDVKYPLIINETKALLEGCFPVNPVNVVVVKDSGCRQVCVYNLHLPCLFPQHGAGRKHDREIRLEPWQTEHVSIAPWAFIRGAIRTDGCVFVNRTGDYEYLSYGFVNRSGDIAQLVFDVCESVGLRPRLTLTERSQIWQLRINRRGDVARMLDHVGIKT